MLREFGDRLQKARREAGYETADAVLERYSNWKEHTYKAHEAGRRIPKDDTIRDYARAFKVRLEWLRYDVGPMRDEKFSPEDAKTDGGFGDAGRKSERDIIFDTLDLFKDMTPIEQEQFLALAMIHKKDIEPGRELLMRPQNKETAHEQARSSTARGVRGNKKTK